MTILETFIKLRDDLKLWVTNNLKEKANITYVDNKVADIDFPVDSVNGKTGAVQLTAADVGALSEDTVIPSLEGVATEDYVDGAVEGLATEVYVDDIVVQKSQVQMITNETSEVLQILKIHKLTQEEYDQKLSDGTCDDNALYLTPDEEIDLSPYATIEQLNEKANVSHNHDDVYYTESEMDTMLLDKADVKHNHDDVYETKGAAETALDSAKSYADNAASSVKDDLLNGAGAAYDTLKELGDLINENTDAIEALEIVASGKANADHNHNDIYYTETEIDSKVSAINTSISNSLNEAKSYSNSNLNIAQTYTDSAVAQKTQVQIITWEDDD